MHGVYKILHLALSYHGIIFRTGGHAVGACVVEFHAQFHHLLQVVLAHIFVADVHEHEHDERERINPVLLEEIECQEDAALRQVAPNVCIILVCCHVVGVIGGFLYFLGDAQFSAA